MRPGPESEDSEPVALGEGQTSSATALRAASSMVSARRPTIETR